MASTTFQMTDPTGVVVNVKVTEVTDETTGITSLQFSIDVDEETGVLAEVNGVFFDLGDAFGDVEKDSLTVTDAISISSGEEDISNLGGGINVKGDIVKTYDEFDAGVVVDETGLAGSYETGSYEFTVSSDSGDLFLSDFLGQDFALRLTSVGEDGSQEGSLKLGTTVPTEPDPEEPEDPGFPPEEPEGPLEPEQPEGVVDSTDGGTTDGETTTGEDPATGEDQATGEDTTTGEDPTTGEDTTTSEDPATGGDAILTDPLMDELFNFQKDETGGDTDGNVLANDDTALTIVSVTNSAGETFDVVESGTTISGTEGGSLTVYPDGTVDFDAGEDFGSLYEGESSDVVFSYTTDSDQTGTLTVTVDGAGAPDDGGDIPLLPPIEEEGTDTTLDPNLDSGTGDPLLEEDFILG